MRAHYPELTCRRGSSIPRPGPNGADTNGLRPFKASYEALGGVFVEHEGPAQLLPAVWLTGPVPRQYPERNYGSGRVQTPTGIVEDNVPEDASVIVDTPDGLILVSGCGHAGIINTIRVRAEDCPSGASRGGGGRLSPVFHRQAMQRSNGQAVS